MFEVKGRFRALLLSLLLIAPSLAWVQPVSADTIGSYNLVDLGTLGGTTAEGWVINASGQVAGTSDAPDGSRHAFLWTPSTPNGSIGSMVDLGLWNGDVTGINAVGQVVGDSLVPDGRHTFLWTPNTPNGNTGSVVDLGMFGGTYSEAYGINDLGQVVGRSDPPGGSNAFLWTPSTPNGNTGSVVDLGTFGGPYSEAYGINDLGQVVGYSTTTTYGNSYQHAFLWTPSTPNGSIGSMVDLGTFGGSSSEAYGINDLGQVVGDVDASPFLWTPNTPNGSIGSMVDLGGLGDGSGNGQAYDINVAGQVVGYSTTTYGSSYKHAFLWTPNTPNGSTGSMVELDMLTGGNESDAGRINDAGQVAGWSGVPDATHAILWTPTNADPPSPAPVLTIPSNFTANAFRVDGSLVTYQTSATNGATVNCDHPSGSLFPIGTTTVSCTATDSAGLTDTKTFSVTVNRTPATPIPAISSTPDRTYFPETAHSLGAPFKTYWEHNGGLMVFGFPRTEPFQEANGDGHTYLVQYFERQRLEYHPEKAGTPYEIELGLLGNASANEATLRSTPPFLPISGVSDANCTFTPETGHTMCFGFRSYWQAHGLDFGDAGMSFRESLGLFGFPISQEFTQASPEIVGQSFTTQYFERAVFEYHPENAGTPYTVLGRLLGSEELQARGWIK